MAERKSLDEHARFVRDTIRLMARFLWDWRAKHPHEDFRYTVEERIDLYRRTVFNPDRFQTKDRNFGAPGWRSLVAVIAEAYSRHATDGDIATFTADFSALVEPFVAPRFARDHAEGLPAFENRAGCFRFDPPYAENPKRVFFHIHNDCEPDSIFDDRRHIPRSFLALMEMAERQYAAIEIETNSWLNEHPRWLEYFPEDWRRNMLPPDTDIRWHYGFWGQFVTARGTLHEKNAAYYAQTGQFPFYPRRSWCGFAELRVHLTQFLART